MVATLVKRYSFEEYCQYDDGTDTRYELDNGVLQAMTPPSFRHILLAEKLSDLFKEEIIRLDLPFYCLREVGLRVGYNKSRIADVMIVAKDEILETIDQKGVYQATPFLIIEIVSPESVTRDYRYKRSEYAAIAVPEYWVIDPIEGKVTTFIFNEGLYDEIIFTGEQNIASLQFPELKITPQTIFSV